MKGLPHILLLVTDQFRYDAVSSVITPNLHALERRNGTTTFHRAYTSTPTCTPARTALLTGKSPWAHGLLAYGKYVNCTKYPTTLPKVLQTKGYRTVVVGKNHFGPIKHIQGFENETLYEGLNDPDDYDDWFNNTLPGMDPKATCDLDWNDWPACPYYYDEYTHPTAWTTRTAVSALNEHFQGGRNADPLLLKVSYHRPHSPYDPPRRILDQYLPGGSKSRVPQLDRFVNDSSWDTKYKKVNMTKSAWAGNPGFRVAKHSRAGYLGSVEFVDENVGKIFDWIQEKGMWDDFMLVWVSDHGDQNGDHYLWRKGYPWEANAHIRMVMKLPHSEHRTARNSNAVTELRDVAPTLYDLTGVLSEVQARDPLMDGSSLLPILQGRESSVRDWVDLEHGRAFNITNHWNALAGYLQHDGDSELDCIFWKYIFYAYDASEQLFCLSHDPHESNDLSSFDHYQKVLAVWRKRLIVQFETEGRGEQWVVNHTLPNRTSSTTYGKNYPCKSSQHHRGIFPGRPSTVTDS